MSKVEQAFRTSSQSVILFLVLPWHTKLLMKLKLLLKLSQDSIVVDYKAIPAVVFSDPECSSVGFTEKEAKEKGYNVKAGKFPFAANGRAYL